MCAPCKVILNEENSHAAHMGHLLRELALNPPDNPDHADETLYELAKVEVRHIVNMRRQMMAAAVAAGASERWMDLMREVCD